MRFAAPVLIVLILVLGALIALRMVRSSNNKKDERRALSNRANLAEKALSEIVNEVNLALPNAQAVDVFILNGIIRDYNTKLESSNTKEISR